MDIADELSRLATLHSEGYLTDEDFESQREVILEMNLSGELTEDDMFGVELTKLADLVKSGTLSRQDFDQQKNAMIWTGDGTSDSGRNLAAAAVAESAESTETLASSEPTNEVTTPASSDALDAPLGTSDVPRPVIRIQNLYKENWITFNERDYLLGQINPTRVLDEIERRAMAVKKGQLSRSNYSLQVNSLLGDAFARSSLNPSRLTSSRRPGATTRGSEGTGVFGKPRTSAEARQSGSRAISIAGFNLGAAIFAFVFGVATPILTPLCFILGVIFLARGLQLLGHGRSQ